MMKLKSKLDVSERGKMMKAYHRRPSVRRLWESYLSDLGEAIEMWKQGELSDDEMRQALYSLFLALVAVDDEDEIKSHLREVDLVVLDDQLLIINGIQDLITQRGLFDLNDEATADEQAEPRILPMQKDGTVEPTAQSAGADCENDRAAEHCTHPATN
jgi:hypothetical protein